MKLLCVSNIAVHALPLWLASMPAVRFDLNAGDSDIRAQLKKIASGQNTIMNKIRENNDDLKTMIATEVSKVGDDIFLEMSQITRRLDILESRSPVATNTREPFSPDVTVVIANLALVSASETEAALMDKINHVLAEGLALPGIEPVAVTRRAARGRGPGLVLLELNDVGDKITVESEAEPPK